MAAQKKPLLPAYGFIGDDQLKRTHFLKRMTERLATLGDLSMNTTTILGAEFDADDFLNACNSFPFCAEKRLVVVKEVEKCNKAALDIIASYLEDPCDTAVVILEGEKLAKNTRAFKRLDALGKGAYCDCSSVKSYELPRVVRDRAVSHGIVISEQNAKLLVERVGESTVALDTELAKLASFVHAQNRDEVHASDIGELVATTQRPKPWHLADALSARDLGQALRILALCEDSPYVLLPVCLTRIRELITTKCLDARPSAPPLHVVLKVPEWRVKNHRRWAGNYSDSELRDALVRAAEAEKQMKSGTDPSLALELWIIGTILF